MSFIEALKPRPQTNGGLKLTQVLAVMLIPAVWLIDTTIMAPALGPIHEAFPTATTFWVNVVFVGPYATSIIFSAWSGRLARRFDKRLITVVGLLLYGIVGLIPAFGGSLLTIFFLRMITGVGLGLALPMPNLYIRERYAGVVRERLLGWANGVAQAANILVLVVVDNLMHSGWRTAFYAYGIVIIIALVQLVLLPRRREYAQSVDERGDAGRTPLRWANVTPILGIAAAMTLLYLAFSFAAANISLFIVSYKLPGVASLGLIATAPAIGNILGSLLSQPLSRASRMVFLCGALFLLALAFFLFSRAGDVFMVVFSSGLAGFATGLLTPYLIHQTIRRNTGLDHGVALGLVTGCINVGVLIFPWAQQLIGIIDGNSADIRAVFQVASVGSLAAMVICFVFVLTSSRRRVAATAPVATGQPMVGSGGPR